MEIYEKARLAQLAARLRLNALNGNVANGAAPGFAVKPSRSDGQNSSTAPPAAPAKPYVAPALTVPASFSRLKIDLPELLTHLSNAREIYTAKSAVSKSANQLYGTMIDVLEDSGDMTDCMLEEDAAMVEEADLQLEADAIHSGDEDTSADDAGSTEMIQVAAGGFNASA